MPPVQANLFDRMTAPARPDSPTQVEAAKRVRPYVGSQCR